MSPVQDQPPKRATMIKTVIQTAIIAAVGFAALAGCGTMGAAHTAAPVPTTAPTTVPVTTAPVTTAPVTTAPVNSAPVTTTAKAKVKPVTVASVKPKPRYTCDLNAPVKMIGNVIVNRACNYTDTNGHARSYDPWIDGQLTAARAAKVAEANPGAAALAACRAQKGWTTAQCVADSQAGNAN